MDNNSGQTQFADTKQLDSNGSYNFTATASATTTTSSGPTFHFLLFILYFLCLLINFINAYNKLEEALWKPSLISSILLILLLLRCCFARYIIEINK